MASKRELLRRQRRWAQARGLNVDNRGYLDSVDANLWRPLSAPALAAFASRGAAELLPRAGAPPKMQALHSSAAPVANVFDHWSERDTGPLLAALGIPSALRSLTFEAEFPTGLPGQPPCLDVALELVSGRVAGIESKFTEWLTPTAKRAFKDKYLAGQRWTAAGLPRCQSLVADIASGRTAFRHLDAPQLLKHALGLATQRPRGFSLLYLYCDLPNPAAPRHEAEIARFEARLDGVCGFEALSYQTLYARLVATGGVDPDYLAYQQSRYYADAQATA